MRTIIHIVVAFAMLFGSFASFNTPTAYSAASPQPELTGTLQPTETVLPTQDPSPTATLPLAETPPPAAIPTPTPTPEARPGLSSVPARQ